MRKTVNQSQPKNPLHGITLKSILAYLVAEHGWERLGDRINIQCFNDQPSINSSQEIPTQDLSLAANRAVYVHCFGGMGRTGATICCWLLRHGLAAHDNVLSLLTQLRQADVERASWKAPENHSQEDFVLSWTEMQNLKPTPTKFSMVSSQEEMRC